MQRFLTAAALAALCSSLPAQDRTIRVPLDARISPDGQQVVFAWRDDVWIADVDGNAPARRLTWNVAEDRRPIVSPDGRSVLFQSDRSGDDQVWMMSLDGGAPRQITFDSEGKRVLEFTADGSAFLAVRNSDRSPFSTEARRLVVIPIDGESPERTLFDAGANDGTLSPEGDRVLFTRGRSEPTRKGYRGAAASQIWLADLGAGERPELTRLSADLEEFQNVPERDPMWAPGGEGYYFVSDATGTFEVWHRSFGDGEARQVTDVGSDGSDDGVLFPSLSADGSRMLFLRRFDLHVHDVESGTTRKLDLTASGDSLASPIERRRVDGAEAVAFTDDGKQIALVAGHDLYVMDRILREPVRVTHSTAIEDDPVFADGGKRLYFVSEADGESDIYEVTTEHADGYWWRTEKFGVRKITDDKAVERELRVDPTDKHIAYVKDNDLYVMDADGSDHRRIVQSWDQPEFDWSPDGRWLCYSVQDADFNSDVWVVPIDGSRPAFNLSRHPDNDRSPVWSTDGERIAWTARRDGTEYDIYYLTLRKEKSEETERDRKLKEALEAMSDGKKKRREKPAEKEDPEAKDDEAEGEKPEGEDEKKDDEKKDDEPKPVEIDFEDIRDRLERISISDSFENVLVWSPDGKTLAFWASIDGDRAYYSVTFPDELRPKKVGPRGIVDPRWLKEGDQIVGRDGGKPASMKFKGGKIETFDFTVLEERNWHDVRRLAFDQGWRAMRDSFYDPNLNDRDWEAVRAKYREVAAELLGREEFSLLMNMMLGELNASHMGHRGGRDPLPRPDRGGTWAPRTFHLGLRFDPSAGGPGLLVESVIPGSPCAQERSRIHPGERLLSIDGQAVSPDIDLYAIMTMPEARDMSLVVRNGEATERTIMVRPVASVSGLLYDEWVDQTRARVDELSGGRLGYLHIRGMNNSSFQQLEEDLFAAGAGKDGLLIDVRFNGGGSTADHVLTVLTQPRHAITVPRGGEPGYPQDRKVYASWWKPIVLLCNEMSFSNAEILSHAVKSLDRGKIVGMRTAGGVISTGARGLVDNSTVRMPFRGWFVITSGQDMELNGCLPDFPMWNHPYGPDQQLEKAIQVLVDDCNAFPEDPAVVPASER